MTTSAADPYGTVTVGGETAILTFVRRLPHPVDAVWAALTDPEQRARWFGTTTIAGRVGGTIEMDPSGVPVPREAAHVRGRILVWDPPRVLEHEWHQPVAGDGVVRYELAAEGDGTVLTFTHRGLRPGNARGFVPGTHAYLDRLRAVLDGEEPPVWDERRLAVEPAYR
jgi:uncharacterized protein YndB with AHSA1/START domain